MLKTIPPIISPELMKAMMEMGHEDLIMLADSNAGVHGYGVPVVRLDGIRIPALLEAMLRYFPLDIDVEYPVCVSAWDKPEPAIWQTFEKVLRESEEAPKVQKGIQILPQEQFIEKVMACKCFVATGETELNANIILRKGVVVWP